MMGKNPVWIIFLLVSVQGESSVSTNITVAIFTGYDSGLKPLCRNSPSKVTVAFDIAVRQIVDLDEPSQIIKLNLWVRMNWHDCRLGWDKADYDDIEHIAVPVDRVWVPDITLYDSITQGFAEISGFSAKVYSDGTVSYNFPALTESQCKVNVRYFPFDSQICKLIFSSWVHDGLEIDIVNKSSQGDLANMEPNVEWSVANFPVVRHELYYACCLSPFPDVTFYLELERKSDYYIFQIIVPCSIVSLLGILGFILPPESGEKVSVGVTILLSQAVFQMLVGDMLPPSSETLPLIAIYFDFSMMLVGFACLTSVVTLNIFYSTKPVPGCVRSVFFTGLSKLVCVDVKKIYATKKQLVSTVKIAPVIYNGNGLEKPSLPGRVNSADVPKTKPCATNGSSLLQSSESNARTTPQAEDLNQNPNDWHLVSFIVDRLGLMIYITLYFGGSLIFIICFVCQ